MISRTTSVVDDFSKLSAAVAAAHRAASAPSILTAEDTARLNQAGVPPLAVHVPEYASRRARHEGTAVLPEEYWKPIIHRLRLAAAKERLAFAIGKTGEIGNTFPDSRLQLIDMAIIERRLYGSPDKWRGRFSATTASVAWLREFEGICRLERWTAEVLWERINKLRAFNLSWVVSCDKGIVDRLLFIETVLTRWVQSLPEDHDVIQNALAIEAEILRGSRGGGQDARPRQPSVEAGPKAAGQRGPQKTDDDALGKLLHELRTREPQPSMEEVRQLVIAEKFPAYSISTLERKLKKWCQANRKKVPPTKRGVKPGQRHSP